MNPMHHPVTMAKNHVLTIGVEWKAKSLFCSAISGLCTLWTNKSTRDQSTGPLLVHQGLAPDRTLNAPYQYTKTCCALGSCAGLAECIFWVLVPSSVQLVLLTRWGGNHCFFCSIIWSIEFFLWLLFIPSFIELFFPLLILG